MQRAFKLVETPSSTPRDTLSEAFAHSSPLMRLYSRWLAMFDKNPLRCGLGPQRSRLIEAWLLTYSEETLAMAIDGAAADDWVRAQTGQVSSIEWLLRSEASIERFAEAGDRLHAKVAHAQAVAAVPHIVAAASDPDYIRQQIERLQQVKRAIQRKGG
jgi:hypothetical protein